MTREELEEKIKNEEVVWTCNVYNQPYKLKLKSEMELSSDGLLHFDRKEHHDLGFCSLCQIFKTEEEARFYVDYANVARIETLPFMTWEEFNKNYLGFEFSGRRGHQYRFWFNGDFKIQITDEKLNRIEEWDANKENFYKAYKVCKDLFLEGEYEKT